MNEAGRNFFALGGEALVSVATGKYIPGGKVIANTVVVADGDIPTFRRKRAADLIVELQSKLPDQWKAVLESQFIAPNAAFELTVGDFGEFLRLRAQSILAFAQGLAFPQDEAD